MGLPVPIGVSSWERPGHQVGASCGLWEDKGQRDTWEDPATLALWSGPRHPEWEGVCEQDSAVRGFVSCRHVQAEGAW